MLNPDGVVVGNYRCGLAGLDLNREYRDPGPAAPAVRALKDMARAFAREREVRRAGPAGSGAGAGMPGGCSALATTGRPAWRCLRPAPAQLHPSAALQRAPLKPRTRAAPPRPSFVAAPQVVLLCDLHGHSQKRGIFAYGCDPRPKRGACPAPAAAPAAPPGCPAPGSLGAAPGAAAGGAARARLFPLMLALNAPDLFSYGGCSFAVRAATLCCIWRAGRGNASTAASTVALPRGLRLALTTLVRGTRMKRPSLRPRSARRPATPAPRDCPRRSSRPRPARGASWPSASWASPTR
jgi:hypothetical protein